MERFSQRGRCESKAQSNHTMNYIGIDIHKKQCVLSAPNLGKLGVRREPDRWSCSTVIGSLVPSVRIQIAGSSLP